MARSFALRMFRSGRLSYLAAMAVLIGLLVPTVAVAAPAEVVEPATVFSSIESCSVNISPSTFGSTGTITFAFTFAPSGAFVRVGADGLGTREASVLVEPTIAWNSLNAPSATVAATVGLASGSHSVDFYAVDSNGAGTGQPLCSADYIYDGLFPEPAFSGPTLLPLSLIHI